MDKNSTILITGGTGFVGSHLVEELLKQKCAAIHVTQFSEKESYLSTVLPKEQIHAINLIDKQATQNLFKKIKPDYIFHLASMAAVGKSYDLAETVLQNNQLLQLSILTAFKDQAPDARLLVVGSAEEYGMSESDEIPISESHPFRPISPYGVSKVTQDLLAYAYFQNYGLDIVRVRPFNHIGERQTTDFAIPAFASQIVAIEKGKQDKIKVGNLTAVRDFCDVKDMVKAYIVLMTAGKTGEVYNAGSGKGTAMQEILDMLCSLSTSEIKVETDPDRVRPLDIPVIVADTSKIGKLRWKPSISLKKTLTRIITYWREQS